MNRWIRAMSSWVCATGYPNLRKAGDPSLLLPNFWNGFMHNCCNFAQWQLRKTVNKQSWHFETVTYKHFVSRWILGNFSSLEQLNRVKNLRDFNLRLLGSFRSNSPQYSRFHVFSLGRDPMEPWLNFYKKKGSMFPSLGCTN